MTGLIWDFPLADLAVVRADGTGFVLLNSDPNRGPLISPTWSPDGSWIAFVRDPGLSRDLMIVRFEEDVFGEIVRLTGGLSPSWR